MYPLASTAELPSPYVEDEDFCDDFLLVLVFEVLLSPVLLSVVLFLLSIVLLWLIFSIVVLFSLLLVLFKKTNAYALPKIIIPIISVIRIMVLSLIVSP